MKIRNFANKFLLVALLVVLSWGQTAVQFVAAPLFATAAEDVLTKTYFFDQYNYNEATDESLYEALGVPVYNDYLSALQATRGLNNIVIAVVDSGLNLTHSVFENRVLTAYAKDFSKGATQSLLFNNWYVDENGHGTHVAGIIADMTLSNVKILPIKIFYGLNNSMNDYAYENAVRYLAALKSGTTQKLLNDEGYEQITCNREGVKLNIVAVNFSLGTSGYDVHNTADMANFERVKNGYSEGNVYYTGYQESIDHLLKYDILPIVAAGNLDSRTESKYNTYYSLPGACGGVLAVAAYNNTQNEYKWADFSYHNNRISLSAPGVNIWSACSQDIVEKVVGLEGELQTDQSGEYYEYTYYGTKWKIKIDENGLYYIRNQGTSMAAPFVSACYAMLMSDTSRVTAEDFGLTPWDEDGVDEHFMNVQHKALLAAAATYGDKGITGFDEYYGYGVVTVEAFAQSTMGEPLKVIKYEISPSTTYKTSILGGRFFNDETDWYQVCWILLIGVILIWGFSFFRSYFNRRKINDDEPEQPTFE